MQLAHSIWIVRRPGRSVVGWYVNLEDVHEFHANTITTSDHVLDLWVPVETGEAAVSAEPQVAVATLGDREDAVLGESLINGPDVVEVLTDRSLRVESRRAGLSVRDGGEG